MLLFVFANLHLPSKRVVRLGFIIGFIALIGVLLSGLAAYRVHEQELAIDGIALARAIDVHASLVQDRLTERELLARVASGLFRAPSVVKANMLQPLRSAIYAFKTDFVVAAWIARLKPSELDAAQAELQERRLLQSDDSRFRRSAARHQGDRQADQRADGCRSRGRPRQAGPSGRAYDQHSVIGPMLAQALAARQAGGVRSRSRCCARTDRSASCWRRRWSAGRRCGACRLRHILL